MNKIQNKYKDRDPLETIAIIKKFFIDNHFEIKETANYQTDSSTWWCSISLFKDDIFLLSQNGKGTTEIFSKASGYAELYERFCNKGNCKIFSLSERKVKQERFNKYGYYISPKEKRITFHEALSSSSRINNCLKYFDDSLHTYETYFNSSENDDLVAIPYINFNTQEEKYFIPEFIVQIAGSDGMAAGNTLEEALVQGLSEIYEHMIWDKIYLEQEKPFVELNYQTLNLSEYLKTIIKNILENTSYQIKILDFSYNFNIPVVGVLLIDTLRCNMKVIFGSHPVFEIALERCFTEIYQGIYTNTELYLEDSITFPYKSIDNINALLRQKKNTISNRNCYLEKNFYSLVQKDSFNKEVFLDSLDFTNIELCEYYKQLNNKLGLNFYYLDNSLMTEIKAIHIFLDNYDIFPYLVNPIKDTPDLEKTELLKTSIILERLIKAYFNNKENIIQWEAFFYNVPKLKEKIQYFLNYNCFNFYNKQTLNFIILYNGFHSKKSSFFIEQLNSYGKNKRGNIAFSTIEQYKNIMLYGLEKKYSNEEFIDILKFYHIDINLIQEILKQRTNIFYYFTKMILEPSYNYYHSKSFNEVVQLFLKIEEK